MFLPIMLIVLGLALTILATIAAKKSQRPASTVADPNDRVHPEVKLGVAVTACLGGMFAFIGVVIFLHRIITPLIK